MLFRKPSSKITKKKNKLYEDEEEGGVDPGKPQSRLQSTKNKLFEKEGRAKHSKSVEGGQDFSESLSKNQSGKKERHHHKSKVCFAVKSFPSGWGKE